MNSDSFLPDLESSLSRDPKEIREPVQPVIVIQPPPPRRRWLRAVLPAIILLLAALAVLKYRVGTADWRGLAPGGVGPGILADRPAAADRPADASAPARSVAPTAAGADSEPVAVEAVVVTPSDAMSLPAAAEAPVVLGAEVPAEAAARATIINPTLAPPPAGAPEDAFAVPDAAAAPGLVAAVAESGPDLALADAELFRPMLPTAAAAGAPEPPAPGPVAGGPAPAAPGPVAGGPDPGAPVDSEEVWDDIQEQAKRAAQERAELEGMKRGLLDRDRKESAQRKEAISVEERKRLEENRRTFLAELKKIVQAGGAAAPESIRSLMEVQPGDANKLARDQLERARKLSSSVDLRHAWVLSLRRMGIAESQILIDLERAHRLNYAARNGPKTPDEALVRAARDLLEVPLERTGVVRPAPQPASASPPAPTRPGAGISRRR